MTSGALDELADSNGVIKAKIDEAVIRERLGAGIYSKPSSAFRELYANELRACREARKRSLNPVIEVTLDRKERTLTIQGIDSLGMTREKFANVLAVLGETDNTTGTEIGQWGIGHLAFRAISDAILFEVHSLESGETFAYLGNGDVYQKVPESRPLEKAGTRVTVTLKDGVDMDALSTSIEHICRCSDIDTFLTEIDEEGNGEEPRQINTNLSLAESIRRNPGIPIDIDDEDFSFHTTTDFTRTGSSADDLKTRCETLLLRMPIEAPLVKGAFPFGSSILDIKDERTYLPTADRERLTEQAQKDILEKVKRGLRERLPGILDIRTLDDLRKSPYRLFYLLEEYGKLKGFYEPSTETKEISELCGLQVKECLLTSDGSMKTDFSSLVTSSNNIFCSETLSKEVLYVLQEEYDDAVLFKLADDWNEERSLALFKKYGVRFDAQEDYERIRAGLPKGWRKGIPKGARAYADGDELPYEIVVHESARSRVEQGGDTYYRLTRSSNKLRTSWGLENIVFVSELSDYLPILNQVDSRYKFAKNIRRTKNLLTLEKFVDGLAKKEIETSTGKVTFEGLLRQKKRAEILVYCDARLASVYRPEGVVSIPAGSDTAFELAVWCTYHGVDYKIQYIVSEREFQEATGANRFHYFNRWYYDDWHEKEESFEPEKMAVANCAFHVALAVGDKELVKLCLKAVKGMDDEVKATRLRNFLLELWGKAERR
ncbi:MAG: hypothetical protein JRN45_00610 [Nitrososphaerota archaeon]|nr:hypothetical protein [Nitrososphaerota archaeon]